MRFTSIFVILLLLLLVNSCQNEFEQPNDDLLGYDYHPIFLGKFIEYKVDSVVYDKLRQQIIGTTSFLREEISDSYINDGGQTVYVIQQWRKQNLSDSWKIGRTWWLTMDEEKLIRTEENLSFIKLIFPPDIDKTWDGNSLINERTIVEIAGESIEVFKNWEYRILEKVDSLTIGLKTYEDVITVQQADDENAIERRYSIEKYAKNVGLVYREMLILDTQCIELCLNLSWPEKAEKGFILKQTILNHN